MKSSLELNLNLNQKIVLTEEMRLSLNILSMNPLDLQDLVKKELENNPLLELNSKGDFKSTIIQDDKDKYLESKEVHLDLKDDLLEQLRGTRIQRDEVRVALFIVESLDDKGYLRDDIEDIAYELREPKEKVLRVLDIIQELEPPGVAARSLEECLELQLKRKGLLSNTLYRIIYEYLYLISKEDYKTLKKELKISYEEIENYVKIIKQLNPIPSSGYDSKEEIVVAIPEAYINKTEDGFEIVMNREFYPTININELYKDILKNKDSTKEELKYVKDKLNSAMYLIRSLEKRKSTIYRILEFIVENQREFLEKGDAYLSSMEAKEVAEKLEVHPSTISRAIKNKYVMIENRLYKIRSLFTLSIGKVKEKSINNSTNYIKFNIVDIVKKENKEKPLSDDKICEILRENNMNISRRTVSKYRSELGIKSSSKRKDKKKS